VRRQDTFLSTTQVAKRCGVSSKTVGRWVDGGVLPAVVTSGGHRRISLADVERFIESHRSVRAKSDASVTTEVVIFSEDPSAIETIKVASKPLDTRFMVVTPSDAFECGVILGENTPHIIVLDAELTHLNPLDLCISFKYHPRTEKCHLLILVPEIALHQMSQLQHARADSVLPKPLDPVPCRHIFNVVRHRSAR
jgi:excisionase family DNA binding protein